MRWNGITNKDQHSKVQIKNTQHKANRQTNKLTAHQFCCFISVSLSVCLDLLLCGCGDVGVGCIHSLLSIIYQRLLFVAVYNQLDISSVKQHRLMNQHTQMRKGNNKWERIVEERRGKQGMWWMVWYGGDYVQMSRSSANPTHVQILISHTINVTLRVQIRI